MSEPFSEERTASDAHERRQAESRRLSRAYWNTFGRAGGKPGTEDGRLILADLKKRFGFDRWEMDSEGLPDNTIARRVAMKGPIFHIERMRNTVSPAQKQKEKSP